jgi:hypothetical protein
MKNISEMRIGSLVEHELDGKTYRYIVLSFHDDGERFRVYLTDKNEYDVFQLSINDEVLVY